MLVEVTLTDGHTIYPVFAPEHKSYVLGYYTKMYWTGAIKKFKATMDNGEIIGMGA